MPPRDFDPDEPPAYGQVWEWQSAENPEIKASPFMLVRRVDDACTWQVLWLTARNIGPSMTGLWDDPKHRLKGYRRLA